MGRINGVAGSETVTSCGPGLATWYLLLWWVLTVVATQPMPDLPSSGSVTSLTHHTLVETIAQVGDTSSLIYCYTQHHTASVTMAEAYQEIATKFTGDKLRFFCYDVSMWPGSSKDLKINASTFSNQIPTVIMYENGKEVRRIPTLEEAEDFLFKRGAFTQRDILKRFDLEAKAQPAAAKSPGQDSKGTKKTR